jgi:hypothetical protein
MLVGVFVCRSANLDRRLPRAWPLTVMLRDQLLPALTAWVDASFLKYWNAGR